jgi:hypothetical protein
MPSGSMSMLKASVSRSFHFYSQPFRQAISFRYQ